MEGVSLTKVTVNCYHLLSIKIFKIMIRHSHTNIDQKNFFRRPKSPHAASVGFRNSFPLLF